MENEQIEIFIHSEGAKPKVVAATVDEVLRDVLIRHDILKADTVDVFVFIGECDEARHEPDDVEDGTDQHGPVELTCRLHEIDLKRHRHVHVNKCRHVAVDVNFAGKTKRHQFSPATTVGAAAAWARRKFHLDPATAGEYVLQICGTSNQPRPDKHLGELAKHDQCALCFDLVKEVTPQG
jgi:hypothetical protein